MIKAEKPDYIATFKEVIMNQAFFNLFSSKSKVACQNEETHRVTSRHASDLSEAEINKEYTIKEVVSDDKEIVNFLFTLGCFKGESITLISVLSNTFVITIKDARYSIDADLAKVVLLV